MPRRYPFVAVFDCYTDTELLNIVEKETNHLDREDLLSLLEEVAKRLKSLVR